MQSSVPGSSPSHSERVLLTDNSASNVVRAVPSSTILPVPSPVASGPRQLLTIVNWGPQYKHYVHRPRRSINQWLSVEMLTCIFLFAVEAYQVSPYQLVAVCRRWRNVINSMTHLWSTLHLGTWTEIENVDIRSGQAPLTVNVDPLKDIRKPSSDPPYAGLLYAFKSKDRWQDLVIASIPTPDIFRSAVDLLIAAPMGRLKSLEVGRNCLDSATLTHLLDHISKTAILLSHMTLLVPCAVSSFLQPHRHDVLKSVTTLIVDGKGISQPVDILPLLVHLETFEASHFPLPDYDAGVSLPFVSTLKYLKLRAISIQWMAGRESKYVRDCTIIHALGQGGVQHRIDLPSCRTLTYQGHPMSTIQHFYAPRVKRMVLNSHDTQSRRAQRHLDHLCRLNGGMSQLNTLYLTLQCSEKVLVDMLKYMEPLEKLVLSIAYPSSSWESFLESLAAKPSTNDWPKWEHSGFYPHHGWEKWCSSQTWHANVLPHLKYLGIQSAKGFSHARCLDNCPLFRLIAWTRAQSHPPLEQLKVWEGRGTTNDIVVDYISTGYLERHLGVSRNDYDTMIVRGMITQSLVIDTFAPLNQLHSTVLFRQLQSLQFINQPQREMQILPFLEQIKRLEIWSSVIPAYSLDIDLPLFHTLHQLHLLYSNFSWMIGRSFKTLTEFEVGGQAEAFEDLSGYKGVQVDMPACTILRWKDISVTFLHFFSCPNAQILQWWDTRDRFTLEEAVHGSLHDFLLSCPRLQRFEIAIPHCLGLDSLIQFVFCGAWEQGVWRDIKSVEVKVRCYEALESTRDHFEQMGRHQQHYEKWWREFTVTDELFSLYRRNVILRVSL